MAFEIINEEDSINSELSLEFYDLNMIKRAIQDFRDISDIQTQIKGKRITIKVKTKNNALSNEELFNEFCNYLIGLIKNG